MGSENSRASRVPPSAQIDSRKGTALGKVYAELRRAILCLELEPGSNLDEAELVMRLGVSRTPIREACLLLANDGLVTLSPNRGAYVATVDLANTREFFEALEVSQRLATRWAASRRLEEDVNQIETFRLRFESAVVRADVGAMIESNIGFHVAIGTSCRNCYVSAEYSYLLTLGFRLSQLSLNSHDRNSGYYDAAHLEAIVQEHRLMAQSIVNQDAETADRLAREHVGRFRQKILDYLGGSSTEDIDL
jgi:DNA-binding GntR family transcriptional regulator